MVLGAVLLGAAVAAPSWSRVGGVPPSRGLVAAEPRDVAIEAAIEPGARSEIVPDGSAADAEPSLQAWGAFAADLGAAAVPAAITGYSVDGAGEPIAGIQVMREGSQTRTDATGRFSFREVAAGRYSLWFDGMRGPGPTVVLAPGETRHVIVQPRERTVLVWGQVVRLGPPAVACPIELEGTAPSPDQHDPKWVEHRLETDETGTYCVLLHPGEYRLWVAGKARRPRPPYPGIRDIGLSPHRCVTASLDLRDPPARVRVDLELPGTEIAVRVVSAADGRALHRADVIARGELGSLTLRTDPAGELRFTDLPFGAWELTATDFGCSASALQRVVLGALARSATCEFALVVGDSR